MGKGDKKSRKGKINRGTFGKSRPRYRKIAKKVAIPAAAAKKAPTKAPAKKTAKA